jgi:hypothetical protein
MLISVAYRVILAIPTFQEIFVDLLAARMAEKVCFLNEATCILFLLFYVALLFGLYIRFETRHVQILQIDHTKFSLFSKKFIADCSCDPRGTVPNTQCDPIMQSCQCKVSVYNFMLIVRIIPVADDVLAPLLYIRYQKCKQPLVKKRAQFL